MGGVRRVTALIRFVAPLNFLPGQYVNIRVPDTDQWRSYSFSSAQGDKILSFLIRDIPGGTMSTFFGRKSCAWHAAGNSWSVRAFLPSRHPPSVASSRGRHRACPVPFDAFAGRTNRN